MNHFIIIFLTLSNILFTQSRFDTILLEGVVDATNSSTTTIAAGDSFVGTSTNILNYGIVFVNIYADVVSATDGLKIQQSSDGTNWDHNDEYTVPAGVAKNYSINPHCKYLRVKYINGAGGQSAYRLQTILKANSKPSSHRIQDMIIDEDDAELVKAVLTAKNAGGNFINIDADNFDNLKTVVQRLGASISSNSSSQLNVTQFLSNGEEAGRILDPSLEIARGNITGHSVVHKFGNAPDFDTADNEVTIWDGAEDGVAWENMNYDWSTSAAINSISSSEVADSQKIEIQGLDASWNLIVQYDTLQGRTTVILDTLLRRVFRLKNVDSTNLSGHIFVYETCGTTNGVPNEADSIRAIIHPGNNQTEMAIYTIPNGKTGYLRSWYAGTAGAKKSSNYIIRLYARPFGQVFQLRHRYSINDDGSSYIQHNYTDPPTYESKTDIIMTVEMEAAAATGASAASGFNMVLVDD